jgi:predicted Zn-dependent protease
MLEGLLLERPVTISVVPRGIPRGCGERYFAGVENGIEAWASMLANSPFRLADPGEHADLTVEFVPRIGHGGRDTQGIVNIKRHYVWTGAAHDYQITGVIQIRDIAFGHRLSGNDVERVMAHELGHVLGLGDDYDGPGVMSAFREEGGAMIPSREEAEAVAEFRAHLRHVLQRTRDES